ncbi:hypothetical protein Tco_0412149 [Tanacetum coccineum]
MIIVLEEGMTVEALQTKYPIIDWEVYTLKTKNVFRFHQCSNNTGCKWMNIHVWADELLRENLYTSKQTKIVKCLEASSQRRWFNSEKLVDLNGNHKFSGGLLGIKGFYNFVLLVQLSTAMRRLSTVKLV